MASKRSVMTLGYAGAALLAAALSAPAAAQTPSRPAPPAQASPGKPDPMFAAYGPGFTRVAGSSTCVKIGANVQSDVYGADLSTSVRSNALEPALKSR